ncbi:hypothetical protein N8311_02375 [bacterium]|nr:hypothetical protein [bacterium]
MKKKKFTVHYTQFQKVEIAAYKEIYAENLEEAEKIAARNGYFNYFDDTDQVDKPYEWSGRCQIYKGHLGWNANYADAEMLAEDIAHYDSLDDDETKHVTISNGDDE